jgi:hypothetical protein
VTERTPQMVTKIQMAPEIDGIDLTDDGEIHSRSRLPYPFYVNDDGFVQLQEFWQGHVYKVIGFQNHPAIQRIDLWWDEVAQDPSRAIGKYLVTSDDQGNWGSFPTAVVESEKTEAVV